MTERGCFVCLTLFIYSNLLCIMRTLIQLALESIYQNSNITVNLIWDFNLKPPALTLSWLNCNRH